MTVFSTENFLIGPNQLLFFSFTNTTNAFVPRNVTFKSCNQCFSQQPKIGGGGGTYGLSCKWINVEKGCAL